MAKFFEELIESQINFIYRQKIFFVGTAAEQGRVNVSPKGLDSLRVLDSKKLIWLNLTGSGNETASHLLKKNRMTLMFCSFEEKPLILRLYGNAKVYHPRDQKFDDLLKEFGDNRGARQIFELEIESVQTSCGFAVPFMEFKSERSQLTTWADHKDKNEFKEYWAKKNSKSIDGFETGIFE